MAFGLSGGRALVMQLVHTFWVEFHLDGVNNWLKNADHETY
jgi:hypothetical protein